MKSIVPTLIAAVMALILTGVVAAILELPFGQSLESWMADQMLTWRYDLAKKSKSDTSHKPDARLLLVSIDQSAVNDLGRWPFPRAIHGQFLQVLAPEDPKVLAWDTFFTEKTVASPTANPDSTSTTEPPPTDALQPDDQALVEGARLIPRMITAAQGDPGNGLTLKDDDTLPTHPLKNIVGNTDGLLSFPFAEVPFAELRKVSYFGFAEANTRDLMREVPLVLKINKKVFPSFDLQILMQYYGVDTDHVVVDLGREITLTAPDKTVVRIPIDETGEFLVNYRSRAEDFQTISYGAMGKGLADKVNNRTSPQRTELPSFKDKIVVVGVTLSGVDSGPNPIEAYSPRVVAHLNVLNNILHYDYLQKLDLGVWLPLYALFLFVVGNLMLRVGFAPLIPLGLVAMALLGDAAFAALYFDNQLMPIILPEVGVLLLTAAVPTRRFFGEEREKKRLKNVLRANLSDKVMNKMLREPDSVKLGGAKQEITILFCDIRNFTSYCDDRDPQEVMDTLNEYMEEMTQVIFRHDGTVDKYIGDCIMAFWNAPQPQVDHAERAVACAVEMQETLANFKPSGPRDDQPFLECGIGIHTGEALVGNMGSSLKRNYTAMGSTVNLASRIESLTRKFDERILISKEVVDRLHSDFALVDRGEIAVDGIARPVHIYAVVSEDELAAAPRNGHRPPTVPVPVPKPPVAPTPASARVPEPVPEAVRVSTPLPEPEPAPVTEYEPVPEPTPLLIRPEEMSAAKIARQPLWRQAPLSEEMEQDTSGS